MAFPVGRLTRPTISILVTTHLFNKGDLIMNIYFICMEYILHIISFFVIIKFLYM